MSFAPAIGPQFMDTESCRCAIVPKTGLWRCTGNNYLDIYDTSTSGKFFRPSSAVPVTSAIWGGSPPSLNQPFYLANSSSGVSLQPLTDTTGSTQISLQDQTCTGQNDTSQTQAYYGQIGMYAVGITPQLCFQSGAAPILIQNSQMWEAKGGCLDGFYCEYALLWHDGY
jgi:hypothetical protein